MDTQIIVAYCLSADMLTSLHYHEDQQRQMSAAEVMTTAIVAMLSFKGNFCMASRFLYDGNYIPNMLGKSRFNRRLHNIANLFLTLFLRLSETWKQLNEKSVYVIDNDLIAVCDNYRICRSKIYHGEDWRGYIASQKRYFYGVRIHIMVTEHGEPVEFFLEPGVFSDTSALHVSEIDASQKSDLASRWGILSVPTTFLIDPRAEVRHVNHGVTRAEQLLLQKFTVHKKDNEAKDPGCVQYLHAAVFLFLV